MEGGGGLGQTPPRNERALSEEGFLILKIYKSEFICLSVPTMSFQGVSEMYWMCAQTLIFELAEVF